MPFYYIKSLSSLDSYCFAIGRAREIAKTVSLVEDGRVVRNFSLYEKALKNLSDSIATANSQRRIDPQVRRMHRKLEGMVEKLKIRVALASMQVTKVSDRGVAPGSSQAMQQTQERVRWAACAGLALGMAILGLWHLKLKNWGAGSGVDQVFYPKLRAVVENTMRREDGKYGAHLMLPKINSLSCLPIVSAPTDQNTRSFGIVRSMMDLDPTAYIVSGVLSIAFPVIARLFLTSRFAKLDAARVFATAQATALDKTRLEVFRASRRVAMMTVAKGLDKKWIPSLFDVIKSIEQDGLLLPEAIATVAKKAISGDRSLLPFLTLELQKSFVTATEMAVESEAVMELSRQVVELQHFAEMISHEAFKAHELASSRTVMFLSGLVGLVASCLLNTMLISSQTT